MPSLRAAHRISYLRPGVPMHAHPNRRSVASPLGEEVAAILRRLLDQLGAVTEVDRRDRQRARRREGDQLGLHFVQLDVGDEPAVGEQAERVERHAQGAAGRLLQGAGLAVGRTYISRAPSSMAWEIGVLLATPPSISSRSSQSTGGSTAGMAALGMTASRIGPFESSSSSPVTTSTATTWSGTDVPRAATLEVSSYQPPEAGVGNKVIARAKEAEQSAERIERKDLSAAHPGPDSGQIVGRVDGLGPGGDERSVDRAG